MVTDRAIAVGTHGRYLVEVPAGGGPWPLLVGFHGYAEAAEDQLARLRSSASAGGWLVVAVQGLHRFYRGRRNDVVASWMTRQDRELAIADNLAYVAGVIDAVSREWTTDGRVVFGGFSQGVAMAFRAAAHRGAAVVAFGGDVPPELGPAALARIPSALIGRGTRDDWYARDAHESDVRRLRAAGTECEAHAFDAGHEWTEEVSRAAADFLGRRR
ncbi:MAG: phospholipase [Acidobacteria bacterium]|nr:MAG: phospholipase [Acidobacteriota bacterium]